MYVFHKNALCKTLISNHKQFLNLNQAGELAVTQEARLSDRKLISHFSKINAL